MAGREYYEGDSRQSSYEFVGRQGPNSRSTSPYPPHHNQSGYNNPGAGGDPYASNYGGSQPQSHQQGQYGGGAGGYNGAPPPARYDPTGASSHYNSPPPPYGGQSDPYASQYQQQFGGGSGQQGYGQQQQPAYGQQNPSYGHPQQQQYGGGPGGAQEGDRGVLGALGGAAAGGFGGHKMGHGVIGTIGGAVAGSLLEDHFKKDKKEDKKDKKDKHKNGQQQQQFYGGAPPPQQQQHHNFAGNFSGSSIDITLDRDYDLIARCADTHGGHRLTSINLNEYLTNEWGNLKWMKGGNFGGSARNVRLVDGGRVLEAELADGGGGWKQSYIYLDEKISNDNGELKYLD